MAALRYISKNLFKHIFRSELKANTEICLIYSRLLNYSSIEYDIKHDPAPKFFNKDIQLLLREITRVDLTKVNQKIKLGGKGLEDPIYKFMTDDELKEAIEEAKQKSHELLQIPPVVAVRKPMTHVLSEDPALQGLEESKLVFTDITFGLKNIERIIVVREPDGTLREADWELRNRMNQLYFPQKERHIKPPRMFFGELLNNLLEHYEYKFILDRACVQFEPNDPEYQRVVSVTYQHVNDHEKFDLLRSTRHFGALTFFLVWNKNIDNLLLELIETSQIEEANILLKLYTKIHDITLEQGTEFSAVEDYIKRYSNKKAALELGLQAYKDLSKQKKKYDEGIQFAHGTG
ncbi:28S ribosomal protein S22, mitochondrial [Diabrotica virgifera virgifera]|uniref:28S ribosomal protein S22, mitochondrial n=1 Tax=Diabrotica virgifera virgifera TaxID=50390 RepID=A0A6P7GBK4_DIAVI|nr:28S ribosomal protein S22, mitochondrial [Diabrotica virgifera virgifera]